MPSSFRNSWSRFTDSVLQRLIPRGVITDVVFTQSNHSRTWIRDLASSHFLCLSSRWSSAYVFPSFSVPSRSLISPIRLVR